MKKWYLTREQILKLNIVKSLLRHNQGGSIS